MRLVIADTGPINYLILIGQVEILPALFERIVLPSVVRTELSHPDAPPIVRAWIENPPVWLQIVIAPSVTNSPAVYRGEAAAIDLAISMQADLLLIDDRRAANLAKRRGVRVTGTLGLIDLAANRGLLDFRQAIESLARTSFRRPHGLIQALLKKHENS